MTEGELPRHANPLLAAVLVTALAAATVAIWAAVADRSCTSTTALGCAGPSIVLAVIGAPVGLLLAILALRASGARSATVGVLFLAVGGWILAPLTEVVEPSLWTWPLLLGGLAAAYVAVVEPRVVHRS